MDLFKTFPDVEDLYFAWDYLVRRSDDFVDSPLFKYDLVDFTKEALRWMFSYKYPVLLDAWNKNDLYKFSELSGELIEILDDMEELLASDEHYLLSTWLNRAKAKGSNKYERDLYEFNARSQITLWGSNKTSIVFDYAAKAWSGLISE